MLQVSGELAKIGHASVTGFRTAEEFLLRELEKIDATQAGTTEAQYVLTGIKLWDELLGGVPRGFLTIIAAQPGVGKSSMLATMARSLAEGDEDERLPEEVAVFSLEDEGGWMPRRYLAEEAELSIRQLVKRGLEKDMLGKVHNAGARIAHVLRRIHIHDVRRMNVHRVAAAARQIIAQRGVRVIIVDHLLEMLDFTDQRSRDERIGEILSVLRDLAVECGVAVVLAAHLKDPDDSRVDARYIRPKLQDFAGGRFVDRMARVAVGLWFAPKPPEPKEGKPPAEPKRGVRMKEEEWAALLEKHEAAKKKAGFELERKRREWEEKCALASESLVCTILKANEGDSGFDFTLRRVKHAGLISRTEGGRNPGELGYTPAAR
jgi:replicative DNA helicase